MKIKRPKNKNVEVSFLELKSAQGKRYKVTRKYALEGVNDTKIFDKLADAKKQLKEWQEW